MGLNGAFSFLCFMSYRSQVLLDAFIRAVPSLSWTETRLHLVFELKAGGGIGCYFVKGLMASNFSTYRATHLV